MEQKKTNTNKGEKPYVMAWYSMQDGKPTSYVRVYDNTLLLWERIRDAVERHYAVPGQEQKLNLIRLAEQVGSTRQTVGHAALGMATIKRLVRYEDGKKTTIQKGPFFRIQQKPKRGDVNKRALKTPVYAVPLGT